jgi:cobalt/nickel transport protein
VWLEEEKLFFHDTVKVVYHVQTQNGWDAATGSAFEIVPLTRPYGLQPGLVLQGQVLAAGKPVAGTMVEVEQYHPTPPKALPPDEQMTRTVKSDPNGVFTCTLTDPGWWCVTAERDGGKRERDGKMYPVKQRTTFWVYVDDAPKAVK